MPIIDITGFTSDEVPQMNDMREAIQTALMERFGFEDLGTTTVNFLTDPSVETSTEGHAMARVYTQKFIHMTDGQRDRVCDEIVLIMEWHGGHTFNEAFAPGYKSMRGGWKPYSPKD